MSCRHTIECEHCWNETTVERYESEHGCEHCELGPNVEQSGIQCDCCERSFSDECGWDNAYSKLIWKYGLEDHPAANEWTMMCPHCQEHDDLVEMYDQEADDMAMDYYREQQEKLKKALFSSLKTAAGEYIARQKNRCAMRTFLIGSRVSNNEMEPISRQSFLHAQQYITALLA